MSNEPEYIKQLRELNKDYSGKVLEQALGVTTRSIQKYLQLENPTVPGDTVIDNIREAFAKHIKGESIKKNPAQEDQDFKAKYIALLEETAKDKTEIQKQLKDIQANLEKIPDSMNLLTDLLLKGQEKQAKTLGNELKQAFEALHQRLPPSPSNGTHKKPVRKEKH